MKKSTTNSTPLLVTVLAIALLGALFYFFVLPKTQEVKSLEASNAGLTSQVQTMQQQLATLSEQSTDEVTNEFAVRKKLPAERGIEKLLMNIEEISYVTNTRISAIGFNNYDTLVNSSQYVDPNAPKEEDATLDPNATPAEGEQPAEQATDNTQAPNATTTEEAPPAEGENTTDPTSEDAPVSTIDVLSLPTNLKMVTFNVTVDALSGDQLVQFIKEIEKLERVMHVDTIDFALLGEEATYTEDASQIVSTTIQVTTFYYE